MAVRIVSDQEVLSGAPCFQGTRIPVHDVADMVVNGVAFDSILETYPRLTESHVKAAVNYANGFPRPRKPHPFAGWRKLNQIGS